MFGFSRGAFGARILATMLNFAGIVREAPQQPRQLRRHTPHELGEIVHGGVLPRLWTRRCG
ncbi:phospholipase effector Tle1 domain-containing protein [Roseateles sp.]|uniref:phospholipase effector Tle1 domain-containing protein n=1 Tax=Roseateles sp. TaxID=1971397 RepID=UPI003D0A9B22